MISRPIAWIVLLSLPLLAGCADAEEAPAGFGEARADAQTGAIAGLLVDDRFRPIHLVEVAASEFQSAGFVLLTETGDALRTNENGEFSISGLEPGRYTLRVAADGHEAAPQEVDVRADEVSEVTLVARRTGSGTAAIVTQEHSTFIACTINFVANGFNYICDGDLSQDSYDSSFESDFSGIDNVTFLVTEFRASQGPGFEIQIRPYANPNFATATFEGDYAKITNQRGVANTADVNEVYDGPNIPWENGGSFETLLFVDHKELKGIVPGTCCGLGLSLGVKGQFLQSVFIGTPQEDLAAYCRLC